MSEHIDEELNAVNKQGEMKQYDPVIFEQEIKGHCSKAQVVSLDEGATVQEAMKNMKDQKIGAVPITRDGKLVGIFTEQDVVQKCGDDMAAFWQTSLKDVMTSNPVSLTYSDSIAHVLNKMQLEECRHIPVVDDNNQPVNLLSVRDVLLILIESFPEDLLHLPVEPYRGERKQDGE